MAWRIRRTSWCCCTDTGRYTAVSCFKEMPKNRLCSSAVTDPEDTEATGQGQLGPKARSKMKIIEGSVAQASSLAPDSYTPSQRHSESSATRWEPGLMSTLQPQINLGLSKEEKSQSQPETAETEPELQSSWNSWESEMSKINHGVKH